MNNFTLKNIIEHAIAQHCTSFAVTTKSGKTYPFNGFHSVEFLGYSLDEQINGHNNGYLLRVQHAGGTAFIEIEEIESVFI